MKDVRFGIVGLGMGGLHARNLTEGRVTGGVLTAVCDQKPDRLAAFPGAAAFTSSDAMIRSGAVDAVVVATPHYSHPDIAIAALKRKLHVLVEKPIAVHKAEAERLVRAAKPGGPLLAVMLNQRTDPRYRKIRELVQTGALGKLQRVNWIITNWFRSDCYFRLSDWRGTWAGEGGGLLMNQCPHQIDLLQWLFGMPRTVRAWCSFGKYHPIEVEDEVTAYFEYANGATGVFVASTSEAPGTNRLEVAGDLGRVVLEGDRFEFVRNAISTREFSRTTDKPFQAPPKTVETLAISGPGGQHAEILQNFIDAIREDKPLIAPGADGVASVELANAMLHASVREKAVTLPLNARAFTQTLKGLVAEAAARQADGKAGTP